MAGFWLPPGDPQPWRLDASRVHEHFGQCESTSFPIPASHSEGLQKCSPGDLLPNLALTTDLFHIRVAGKRYGSRTQGKCVFLEHSGGAASERQSHQPTATGSALASGRAA